MKSFIKSYFYISLFVLPFTLLAQENEITTPRPYVKLLNGTIKYYDELRQKNSYTLIGLINGEEEIIKKNTLESYTYSWYEDKSDTIFYQHIMRDYKLHGGLLSKEMLFVVDRNKPKKMQPYHVLYFDGEKIILAKVWFISDGKSYYYGSIRENGSIDGYLVGNQKQLRDYFVNDSKVTEIIDQYANSYLKLEKVLNDFYLKNSFRIL